MSNSADGEEAADKGPGAEDVAALSPPPPRASSVASDASSAASSVASAPPTVTPRLSKADQDGQQTPQPEGNETPPPPPPPPPLTPSSSGRLRPQSNGTKNEERPSGGGGSHSAGGGRRPVKIWNSGRTVRKALVVSTYEEFQRKGREKLGLGSDEPISIVLEGDGTQVDDGEYFQTLPENSIFMFLRSGESWHPTGSDTIKAAVMEAIPNIICDTLFSLGLHDQTPSWKIMDNKGRITVVLHWEPEDMAALRGSSTLPAIAGPSRQNSACSTIASGGPRLLGIQARSISQRSGSSVSSTPCLSRDNSRASGGAGIHQHSMLVQTSFDSHRDSSKAFGPHITVINHDGDKASNAAGGLLGPPLGNSRGSSGGSSLVMGGISPRQLSRQGSSVESTAIVPIHHHTVECSATGRGLHQPTYSKRGSPTSTECDFHCCALHSSSQGANGPAVTSSTTTTTHKSPSSATSPMQQHSTDSAGPGGAVQPDGKRSLPKGAHVRFSHVEVDGAAQDTALNAANSSTTANNQETSASNVMSNGANATANATTTNSGSFQCRAIVETTTTKVTTAVTTTAASREDQESSESETDNNDETGTTNKFLLLVDQLSLEQPHHLSIKDIGIILDRLSSKIIDVAMLERQIEATDTHNWTIKATIRGEVMRELGVIYNSNYYAISEHPNFNFSKLLSETDREGGLMDEEDMDDDMDDFEEVDHVNIGNSLPTPSSKIHSVQ